MEWGFFKEDGVNWTFVTKIADLPLPGGGFKVDDLTILSVGIVNDKRSQLKLNPGAKTVNFNTIPNETYYVIIKDDNGEEQEKRQNFTVQFEEDEFNELHEYIKSLDNNKNTLYEYDNTEEPPPIDLTTPKPLAVERNFEYVEQPNVRNMISIEDNLLSDVNNPDNVIFKHGDSFFMYSKDDLQTQANDHSNIILKCTEQLVAGAPPPMLNQIEEHPYFKLSGPNMNYVIHYGQLLSLLTLLDEGVHTFELVQTGDELANTASYLAVLNDPVDEGLGMNGQPINLIGLDHCTAGTNKPVFVVHPLRITAAAQEGGRRRKTRRRSRHSRKHKSRHVNRRRS
jgi:hypothetical protein